MAEAEFPGIYAVVAATAGFYTYYYVSVSKNFKDFFQRSCSGDQSLITSFMASKLLGFFTMGMIPCLLVSACFRGNLSGIGCGWARNTDYWYLFILLPLLIIAVNSRVANNAVTFGQYPELRIGDWTYNRMLLSASGWFLYLLGYEFLFRGVLLFSLRDDYGSIAAYVISIALYSAFHMPKGARETLGAIPFGFVLCYLSLLTGSFLLSFVLHLSLALSTEFYAIRFNPEIKLFRKDK